MMLQSLLSLQGFCSAAFIWKDKLREAPGKVRTLLPAIYTAGHTEGVQTLAYLSSFDLILIYCIYHNTQKHLSNTIA